MVVNQQIVVSIPKGFKIKASAVLSCHYAGQADVIEAMAALFNARYNRHTT